MDAHGNSREEKRITFEPFDDYHQVEHGRTNTGTTTTIVVNGPNQAEWIQSHPGPGGRLIQCPGITRPCPLTGLPRDQLNAADVLALAIEQRQFLIPVEPRPQPPTETRPRQTSLF